MKYKNRKKTFISVLVTQTNATRHLYVRVYVYMHFAFMDVRTIFILFFKEKL